MRLIPFDFPIVLPFALLALAVAAAMGSAAVSQTVPGAATPGSAAAPQAEDRRARLLAADADHDGKWSKAEWLAAGRKERGFALVDTNNDGFVDRDELKAAMTRMHERRAPASNTSQ